MGKLTGKARQRASVKARRVAENKSLKRKAVLRNGIRTFDDPILWQACSPVEQTEVEEAKKIVDLMIRTLKATKNGVGLAATQVGYSKRILVYRLWLDSDEFTVMINPLLVEKRFAVVKTTEECLSFPGVKAEVERFVACKVSWKDLSWQDHENWVENRESIIFQHENDHLDGICKVGEAWKERELGRKDNEEVIEEAIFNDAEEDNQEMVNSARIHPIALAIQETAILTDK